MKEKRLPAEPTAIHKERGGIAMIGGPQKRWGGKYKKTNQADSFVSKRMPSTGVEDLVMKKNDWGNTNIPGPNRKGALRYGGKAPKKKMVKQNPAGSSEW